jgi:hypothetical protein
MKQNKKLEILTIKCKGRDNQGNEILEESVNAKIRFEVGTDKITIFSEVEDCKYKHVHEDTCCASDEEGICAYCVVIPQRKY